jgi:hypothetical protein
MFSATINVSPTESITVRSGNGTVGGPDSQVNMLVGPADTGFAAALTPANFASARTGPDAILCTPNSAWATSIPSDPAARWISDVASGGSFGSTCLFAIPFTVNSADRSAASITFTWIVDNMIGFNPTTRAWESGVFINEVPLPVCNATDLDSMARFFDDPATPNTGLGAGAIDMGAFEFRGASGCPTFNQQPASITRTTGSTSTFTVAATGTPSPTYQWQRNNSNLANGPTGRGSTVSGATSPSLTISNTQLGDAGSYTCVATNPCGNAVSNAAILTVFCRSDFNRDEAVNSQDFFDYLTAFFGGLPSADINGDSAVNSQDFFDFLTAFFAGC